MSERSNDSTNEKPRSVFREVAINGAPSIDDPRMFSLSMLRYFRKMPKEDRSQDDFDALLNMLEVIRHKQKFEENELWMAHNRIFMYKEANANLLSLNRKLVSQLISDADGHSANLNRVLKSFSEAVVSKVVDVELNKEMYTFTKAHLNHICEWYTMGGMFTFSKGEEFMNREAEDNGIHKYSFGEIVLRTYYTKDKQKKTEEVILLQESKFIVDVIGSTELRRVTESQKDGFTMPSFAWHRDIKPSSPRRFLLGEDDMSRLIENVVGFNFDDDEETVEG